MEQPAGLSGAYQAAAEPPTVFDLATPQPNAPVSVPLAQALFAGLGFFLNEWIQSQYSHAVSALLVQIDAELTTPNIGYLVRVNRYELAGVLHIPGGNLLTPIGTGTEPIDALATAMDRPYLVAQPADGAIDRSEYFWFIRSGDRQLQMYREIQGASAGFVARARQEYQKRRLQGYDRASVTARLRQLDLGRDWIAQCEALSLQADSEAKKSELRHLRNEMVVAQRRFEKAHAQYLSAEAALRSSSRFLSTLQVIANVANLVSAVGSVTNIDSDVTGHNGLNSRASELRSLYSSQSQIIKHSYEVTRDRVGEIIRIQERAVLLFRELGHENHPPLQRPFADQPPVPLKPWPSDQGEMGVLH